MLKIFASLAVSVTVLITAPAMAQDIRSKTWAEIVSQAKAEGQVSWFNWYLQDRFRVQVRAFEAEYGIKVTIPDGSQQANLNKLLAEKDRTDGDIDVLSVAGPDLSKVNLQQYFFGPINTALPNGPKLSYSIGGGDSRGYAPAFWGNQTVIAYNPDRIRETDLPRTIDQFAAFFAKNPNEFGFNAARTGGGSGPAFIEAVTRATAPGVDYDSGLSGADVLKKLDPAWNWFNQYKRNFIITASNADSLSRLTGGEFMLVTSFEDYVAGLQKKGEVPKNFRVYVPDFGMPGGGNVVAIPANAKRKAAALVFIHWLTSAKTQTDFSHEFGAAPQNPDADASAALVPAADRRKGFAWAAKPLGDDITNQFLEHVTLK